MVAELRNYIANLNTSGSIALNITKATAYLKSQRRELENQVVPEAARSYTALLGDIRKTEQEISAPQYANQLIEYRKKKSEIKKQLECCQKEKEVCKRTPDSFKQPVYRSGIRTKIHGGHQEALR